MFELVAERSVVWSVMCDGQLEAKAEAEAEAEVPC
jgi:hypothetical protein